MVINVAYIWRVCVTFSHSSISEISDGFDVGIRARSIQIRKKLLNRRALVIETADTEGLYFSQSRIEG